MSETRFSGEREGGKKVFPRGAARLAVARCKVEDLVEDLEEACPARGGQVAEFAGYQLERRGGRSDNGLSVMIEKENAGDFKVCDLPGVRETENRRCPSEEEFYARSPTPASQFSRKKEHYSTAQLNIRLDVGHLPQLTLFGKAELPSYPPLPDFFSRTYNTPTKGGSHRKRERCVTTPPSTLSSRELRPPRWQIQENR